MGKDAKKAEVRAKSVSDETKAQKFQRLAKHRTTKALERIRQLKPLTGTAYESTIEQRRQVVDAILKAVTELEVAFSGSKSEAKGFDFKS
jgi:hypothetical protein